MNLILDCLLCLTLMKLSWDDVRFHRVYLTDLTGLCVLALMTMKPKALEEWTVMVSLIMGLALIAHLKKAMGSGDLPVILSMGLTMRLLEWLNALSLAAILALLVMMIKKKAIHEELPFVPYLSCGWLVIYLIRLRLIFS